MIDFKYKYIYIHIPKTAGIFIEELLHNDSCIFDLVDPIALFGHTIKGLDHKGSEHFSLDEIYNLKILSRRQIDTFYKFGFVRNPWDRMISEIFFLRYFAPWFGQKFSDQFSSGDIANIIKYSCIDYARRPLGIWGEHMVPQMNFLQKNSPNFGLNFLGRFENLNEDLNKIISVLNLETNFPIESPHINASQHEHYTKYYTEETIDLVYQVYKDDVNLLKYEYGQ
jgi:hypothetical protein